MSYKPQNLEPTTTTDEAWALAWVRKMSKDINDPCVWSDPEWLAELGLPSDIHTDSTDVIHYRPHLTAARVVKANPDAVISESLLGGSVTRESVASIAERILTEYAPAMDQALADALPAGDSFPTDNRRLAATY